MAEESVAFQLEHYVHCEAIAPNTTSACLLVPSQFLRLVMDVR